MCARCLSTLRPAPHAVVGTDLVVRSAFAHAGSAKSLVHGLKYQGLEVIAKVLASAMVEHLPTGSRALVPVPRSLLRRVRYGIDPGRELAAAIRGLTGLPVVDCLRPELLHRPNAGRDRPLRQAPEFGVRRPAPPGYVLIDDVLTTGLTLGRAHLLLGASARGAVTATRSLGAQRYGGPEPGPGILPRNGQPGREE